MKFISILSLLIIIVIINKSHTKLAKTIISELANSEASSEPIYIDNTSTCPKLYYSTNKVVENCSSLNLASNWTVLSIDIHFVTELILANNNFRNKLPSAEINQYDSLNVLDLSSNYISEATTDLQLIDCKINNFKEFVFNSNLFKQLPLLNYYCMKQLESLKLNNNKMLVNFDDPTTFTNPATQPSTMIMERLKYLDVSFCNIEQINNNQFTTLKYMPNLIYLNLRGNRIKNIYENPFRLTPYLNYLSFDQNDIQCDVSIQWIKGYLTSKKGRKVCCDTEVPPPKDPQIIEIEYPGGNLGSKPYMPTCFSPLTLQNQSILDFPDPMFLDYINLTTTVSNPESISVIADDSLELDCSLYSRPASDLWWTFNDRVLTRTVKADSPYEFVENFDASNTASVFNKTSVLRIKRNSKELAGKYSCNAFYLNYEPNNYLSIASIPFQVTVKPNPNPPIVARPLTNGEIAGIVIGSILGFLLLCGLIFCCVYCCCFSGAACCCMPCCCFGKRRRKEKDSNLASSIVSTSSSDIRFNTKQRQVTEIEESQSGFKDINRIKPNYVINTISKGSANAISDPEPPESSISWKVLPNKNLTDTDLNTLHNANNLNLLQSTSNSYINRAAQLNQFNNQQDLIDMNLPYEDNTLNFNTQSSYNGKYSIGNKTSTLNKNQHRPQVYSINNPIDYGATYSTNEGYLNDNSDLNQVRFTTDVIINENSNDMEEFEQYDTFNPNGLQHYSNGGTSLYSTNQNTGNNFSSFSKEVTNTETINSRNKQYSNFSSNYVHEVNNTSFVKYDSDV